MYQIEYVPLALQQLRELPSNSDRSTIIRRIRELSENPHAARELKYELVSYRRARAGGQYRIFFRVDEDSTTVQILFIGVRMPGSEQDAYVAFRRWLTEQGS